MPIEKNRMRKKSRYSVLTIVTMISIIAAFALGGYLAQRPSYTDQAKACVSVCKEQGKFGSLVKQDRPYSTKPSNVVFNCECS